MSTTSRAPTTPTPQLPPFYFFLDVMYSQVGLQDRETVHGRWIPPKQHGRNLRYRPNNQPPLPVFYFNGNTTAPRPLPMTARPYSVSSLYHSQAVFWNVDYDATMYHVGDGVDVADSPIQRPHNQNEGDDWRPISFQDLTIGHHHLSYLGRRLPRRKLHYQRPDQLWAEQLLTDVYQADRDNFTENLNYGSLVGNLSLLIGMSAMSLPIQGQYNVQNLLPHMVVRTAQNGRPGWQVTPPVHVPRGSGWNEKRGFVINVYYDPAETTQQDLQAYENGQRGPIYY